MLKATVRFEDRNLHRMGVTGIRTLSALLSARRLP
jgi:hypothetical protein